MKRIIIDQSDTNITSHSGLSLIGAAINRHTNLAKQLNSISLRRGLSHSDLIHSYLGLLGIGKNDFQAIEPMLEDEFFKESMNINTVPSADRLRQRMDERAEEYLPSVVQASIDFLKSSSAQFTALPTGHVPLDADVTPFDNSGSKKEGVAFTYKKHDGYAPMATYLGQEGYCIDFELRNGKQHSQNGTPELLKRILARACELTDQPILLRLDGGYDAIENVDITLEFNANNPNSDVDFIIKWNPRKKEPQKWLKTAEKEAYWSYPRPGKRIGIFVVMDTRTWNGHDYTVRRVMRITERTIDKNGQHFAIPDIEVEGWWTSLWDFSQEIIDLYNDHGTSEQFHSEFKTDMDIERLPSGKFSTNQLILSCSVLIYNILRYIGQNGLIGNDSPVRHPAKRRRIKTVMQELIYLAAKFTKSGNKLRLIFGRCCRVTEIFSRLYYQLAFT